MNRIYIVPMAFLLRFFAITLVKLESKNHYQESQNMTSTGTLTDIQLMKKIAGYDSRALENLYDRYTPILYTLIKKIVSEQQTAEEVLSDVYLIIWKHIDKFDFEKGNVYTWMVTLARNKAIDVMNRQRGRETREYTEEYEREKILPKLSREIEAVELEAVLGMREKVETAMDSLTEAQRYVLELSYYEGLDETGIAQKLKIPASTVKSKLQVAISNLMKKLQR